MAEIVYSLSTVALSPEWADGRVCYLAAHGKTLVLSPFGALVLESVTASSHATRFMLLNTLGANAKESESLELTRVLDSTLDEFVRIGLLSVSEL